MLRQFKGAAVLPDNRGQVNAVHVLTDNRLSQLAVKSTGQEKHLPREARHAVQQKQGGIKPTVQLKGSLINDSVSLEKEADVMGLKATQINPAVGDFTAKQNANSSSPIQRAITVAARKKVGVKNRRRPTEAITSSAEFGVYLGARMAQHLSAEQTTALYAQLDEQNIHEKALLDQAYAILHPRAPEPAFKLVLARLDDMAVAVEKNTKFVAGVGRSTFVDGTGEMASFMDQHFGELTADIVDVNLSRKRNRVISRAIQALFATVPVIRENVGYLIDAGYLDKDDPQAANAKRLARGLAVKFGAVLPSISASARSPRPSAASSSVGT